MNREKAWEIARTFHDDMEYFGEWSGHHVFQPSSECFGPGLTIVNSQGAVLTANPAFTMEHIGDGFTDWYWNLGKTS
jgi:hypothetical protein